MKLNLKNPIVFFDLETTGTNINTDRIVEICYLKAVSYTHLDVYKRQEFSYIIQELLHENSMVPNKQAYINVIISTIISTRRADDFIICLLYTSRISLTCCKSIRLCVQPRCLIGKKKLYSPNCAIIDCAIEESAPVSYTHLNSYHHYYPSSLPASNCLRAVPPVPSVAQ